MCPLSQTCVDGLYDTPPHFPDPPELAVVVAGGGGGTEVVVVVGDLVLVVVTGGGGGGKDSPLADCHKPIVLVKPFKKLFSFEVARGDELR